MRENTDQKNYKYGHFSHSGEHEEAHPANNEQLLTIVAKITILVS